MSSELREIPLEELRVSPFNLRTPDTATPEFQQLLASVEAIGILEPLVVEPTRLAPSDNLDGLVAYDVLQGGHRLMAARERARLDGVGEHLIAVPCQVLPGLSEAEAHEVALATSVIRRPLHPVDEYESFAALAEQGLDAAAIAKRFGLAERQVKQRFKLAELLAEIRSAWREGAVGAETAMAFTLARDADEQARAWKAFGEMRFWNGATDAEKATRLRQLLVGREAGRETTENNRYWRCVGEDAYLAAGGDLTTNLFADERIIEQPALLADLARGKALAEADERARRLGFGGALWKPSLENHWNWPRLRADPEYAEGEKARIEWIDRRLQELDVIDEQADQEDEDAIGAEYRKLEEERDAIEDAAATRALSAEDRARSAVVADIRADGVITLEDGWLLEATPAEKKLAKSGKIEPAAAAAANAKPEEPKGPSAATLQAVSEQLTEAAYRSLQATPAAVVPLLLATLRSEASPLKVSLTSRYARPHGFDTKTLAEEMTTIVETPAEAVATLLSQEIARGLDLTEKAIEAQTSDWEGSRREKRRDARAALLELLDGLDPDFQARLRGQFDAAAYFAAAPKSEAVRAMKEMADDYDIADLKKAALAEIVGSRAKKAGWLPPMMRTTLYALLSAKPAAVPTKKAAAAPKKKPKAEAKPKPAKGKAPKKAAA